MLSFPVRMNPVVVVGSKLDVAKPFLSKDASEPHTVTWRERFRTTAGCWFLIQWQGKPEPMPGGGHIEPMARPDPGDFVHGISLEPRPNPNPKREAS